MVSPSFKKEIFIINTFLKHIKQYYIKIVEQIQILGVYIV